MIEGAADGNSATLINHTPQTVTTFFVEKEGSVSHVTLSQPVPPMHSSHLEGAAWKNATVLSDDTLGDVVFDYSAEIPQAQAGKFIALDTDQRDIVDNFLRERHYWVNSPKTTPLIYNDITSYCKTSEALSECAASKIHWYSCLRCSSHKQISGLVSKPFVDTEARSYGSRPSS